MERNEEVQEFYSLSKEFLKAAIKNLELELYEPAMANGIHALELAAKAALCTVIDDPIKTHNIGGLFGKHFKEEIGKENCKKVNIILMKYNLPRYPGEIRLMASDIREDINFIKNFIENEVAKIIKKIP